MIAVTGIGGIGKTQLVSEFVHHFGGFFRGGVFWLSFDNESSIPSQIAICGNSRYLDLFDSTTSPPLPTQVDLVLTAWSDPIPRLLIFDSCEHVKTFRKWAPTTGGCHIILTSRRSDWAQIHGIRTISLKTLKHEDSVNLLKGYISNLVQEEEAILSQIASQLGNLPLALHLAGSFLSRYRVSVPIQEYLQQISNSSLLNHASMKGRGLTTTDSPTLHEQSITQAFALSFEQLRSTDSIDKLAFELLVRASYLIPGIPFEQTFVFATVGIDGSNSEEVLDAEDAIHRLIDIGLFNRDEQGNIVLHNLVL